MGGGRQAWCPRCDEVRAARPRTSCPVCGRELLPVPAARPGQPEPGRAERLARRLRRLRPAAGAVAAGLLVLAVVASGFAAGRLTRTTPSAPAAATTGPEFDDAGPGTARRTFDGWEAQAEGITVRLRSLTVGTGFSRLDFHIDGVRAGHDVNLLERLRVRDAAGNDLLAGGTLERIGTSGSRPGPGGGIDTEVVFDQPLDLQAVAAVELGGLTVGRGIRERLAGTLLDRELQRRADGDPDTSRWLAARRDCPGCQLRVTCDDCTTMRVVGTAYRHGRILVGVEALDRVEQTALNPSDRRVVVDGEGGLSELPAWMDGSGGTAVISVAADILAADRFSGDERPIGFEIIVRGQAEQVVRGTWALRPAGG